MEELSITGKEMTGKVIAERMPTNSSAIQNTAATTGRSIKISVQRGRFCGEVTRSMPLPECAAALDPSV
jgi:hypothetical protein